jgi:hypothetical protein
VPRDLYLELANDGPRRIHHFWDEPWWRGAFVVRVLGVDQERIEKYESVEMAAPWDATPDAELYGTYWGWAQQFFEAGSMLSQGKGDRSKFVHCFLNSYGMSVRQEFFWALRFAWGRATLHPRLWWRGMRR